jgi:hypothetical protein
MRTSLALLLLLASARADDAAEENRLLRERLAAAEQRIGALEQQRGAQQRAALQGDIETYLETARPETPAPLAGYDNGLFVRDAAGNHLLRLNGQLQMRFAANEQEDSLGDPHVAGFEIPRAKLIATGHVLSPRWQYKLEGNFDLDDGVLTLQDAWVTYYAECGWSVTAGQFKCPVLREEKVDSMYQLAVDRSVVNDALTSGERLQGVAVGYAREAWRAWGAYTDGDGNVNTPVLAGDAEYAFTFRGELLLKGRFDLFEDFTSFRGDAPGILLAINAHFQRGESGQPGPEAEVFLLSFDASFEFGGANAMVEAIYVQLDPGGAGGVREMFGLVAQGGFFVTETVEVFVRYEYADLDPLGFSSNINIGTIGVTRYFDRHRIKLTGDIGYAFDAVPVTTKYSDFREDIPLASGQLVLRIQLQLLF